MGTPLPEHPYTPPWEAGTGSAGSEPGPAAQLVARTRGGGEHWLPAPPGSSAARTPCPASGPTAQPPARCRGANVTPPGQGEAGTCPHVGRWSWARCRRLSPAAGMAAGARGRGHRAYQPSHPWPAWGSPGRGQPGRAQPAAPHSCGVEPHALARPRSEQPPEHGDVTPRPEHGRRAGVRAPAHAGRCPPVGSAPLGPAAGSPARLARHTGSPPRRVTPLHAAGAGLARGRHQLCRLPGLAQLGGHAASPRAGPGGVLVSPRPRPRPPLAGRRSGSAPRLLPLSQRRARTRSEAAQRSRGMKLAGHPAMPGCVTQRDGGR